MKAKKDKLFWIVGAALVSLILFCVLSWPLPRFIASGIPSSAHNIETPAWRYSIPGDHLQFLYRFDLMSDMLAGKIDWFHNPYEFNLGSDEDRFRPGAYFFPLSAVYSALKAVSRSQALAWNLTLWLSVWLSALFTGCWLRRFTRDPVAVVLGVWVALLIPFRWVSLFGGSPSGMALMWLPLLAWGIDVAVRQPTYFAGGWVGLALLFCFWADLQVFYFAALATPVFVLMSLFGHQEFSVPWRQWYRILPLGLLFLVLISFYYLWRKEGLAGSVMGEGRGWHEVRLFSPARAGLFVPRRGVDATIFIGCSALLGLVLTAVLMASRLLRERQRSIRLQGLFFIIVATLLVGTGVLALGANGPGNAWLLRRVRNALPYYSMIRQPFKIYALMPMWFAWLFAIGWTCDRPQRALRRFCSTGLAVIIALAMFFEMNRFIEATVSLFEPGQGAYAAVANDAAQRGASPGRALVVPLWPGESADTALPVHFARQYGLRLVNGYSAAVPQEYVDNVFRRFQSVNQGWIEDEQIDDLLTRGIHYLFLHENQFPEKVSPFPVTLTRDRLMANPRLDFLAQDGPVWAFRLRQTPDPARGAKRAVTGRFPTRRWNFNRMGAAERRVSEEGTHGQRYLVMNPEDEQVTAGPWRVAPTPRLNCLLRIRGEGSIRMEVQWEDERLEATVAEVNATDWQWIALPVPDLPGYGQVHLHLGVIRGRVDADTGLLMAGEWPPALEPGRQVTFAAADFFHAGYSDWNSQSVFFRPEYDPDAGVFYGPKLPLEAGNYSAEWVMKTDAPDGTELGQLVLHDYVKGARLSLPVRAGYPVRMEWTQPHNHVVNWIFTYRRVANVEIERVILKKTLTL